MLKEKKYLSSSFITTAALVTNKSIQFILIAVLTRVMTQESYGKYSVFLSWVNIISIVIGGSLASSFGIAKNDFGIQYSKYLSSCIGLSYVYLGIAVVIGMLLRGNWSIIYLFSVLMHSFNLNIMTNYEVMQGFYLRFKKVCIVSVFASVISSVLIIIFVV